jgi:hypothetical protein
MRDDDGKTAEVMAIQGINTVVQSENERNRAVVVTLVLVPDAIPEK